MLTLRPIKIAALLFAGLLACSPAHAQFIEAGEVFLSFAPGHRVSSGSVVPGIPFDLHVLVELTDPNSVTDNLAGIEGGIELGQSLALLGQEWAGVGLNLGQSFDPGGINIYNFIVGIGECVTLGRTPTRLGRLTLLLDEDVIDHVLSIGAPLVDAATPSSFNGIGPGYANCASDLILFSTTVQGSGVIINTSSVPVPPSTWSTLKSRFGASR